MEDKGESINLANTRPEKAREMLQLRDSWRKRVRADMPFANPAFNPGKRMEWGHHPGIQETLKGERVLVN